MKEEKELKNIFQKMSKATEMIETVKKNLTVGIGDNKYKAVGERDVLDAVKPIEVELGIYSYPYSRKVIDANTLTTTSEYKGTVKEKNQLFMRVETVYRFVNTDNPTDYIDITTYGDGVDSQDKAPGKAMTYGDKYALLKAYKIETGEDPDKDASEELKKVGFVPMSSGQLATMTKLFTGKEDKIFELFGVKELKEVSLQQASSFISSLKIKNE